MVECVPDEVVASNLGKDPAARIVCPTSSGAPVGSSITNSFSTHVPGACSTLMCRWGHPC